MENQFSRTELLIGKDAIEKLQHSKVAIFGIGGVGGHTLEALVRSGVGEFDIIDSDKFCLSNLNRQIYATHKTINQYKVDAAKERILEINPDARINTYKIFLTPETSNLFDFKSYDYIVDAIDNVAGKLCLIEKAKEANIPIICAMGAGNKMDATKFEVADISKTSVCPLARIIRTELKKRKITKVKVVYSKEQPIKTHNKNSKPVPASNAFVPAVAGLIIAGEVVKDLIKRG